MSSCLEYFIARCHIYRCVLQIAQLLPCRGYGTREQSTTRTQHRFQSDSISASQGTASDLMPTIETFTLFVRALSSKSLYYPGRHRHNCYSPDVPSSMELCQGRMRWWQQSKLEQFKCVALREEKRTLAIPKVERRCIGLENYKNKRGAAVKPASSLCTAASSATGPVLEQSLKKHSWSSCSAEDLLMEEPTMEKKLKPSP
jgi:hypothetical protein